MRNFCIYFIFIIVLNSCKTKNFESYSVNDLLKKIDSIVPSYYEYSSLENEVLTKLQLAKNFSDSLKAFDMIFSVSQPNTECHILYQDFMYAHQKRKEILPYYQQKAKENLKNHTFQFLYARILQNLSESNKIGDVVLKSNPNDFYTNTIKLEFLINKPKPDTVSILQIAFQLINLRKNHPSGFYYISLIYKNLFFNHQKAIEYIRKSCSIKLNKENIQFFEELLEETNDKQNLANLYNQIYKQGVLYDNYEILNKLLNIYLETGKNDSAIHVMKLIKQKGEISFSIINTLSSNPYFKNNTFFYEVWQKHLKNNEEKKSQQIIRYTNLVTKAKDIHNQIFYLEKLLELYDKNQKYSECLSIANQLILMSKSTKRYKFYKAKYSYLLNKPETITLIDDLVHSGFFNYKLLNQTFTNYISNPEFIKTVNSISKYNNSFANEYDVSFYGANEGIASINIWSIFQDRKGYVWIGTELGVNEYDGNSFKLYNNSNNFAYNYINGICEDDAGNLFFKTIFNGILKYNGISTEEISVADGLSNFGSFNKSILKDSTNTIWTILHSLKKNKNLSITSIENNKIVNFSKADGIPVNMIEAFYYDEQTHIFWLGTDKGVYKYNGKNITFAFDNDSGLVDNHVKIITKDQENNFWFGTRKGVSKYDGKKFINYKAEDGIINSDIRNILFEGNNIWFVAYERELSIMKDGKIFAYFPNTFNEGYRIHASLIDNTSSIWLGFFNGSLIKIKNKDYIKCDNWNENDYWINKDGNGNFFLQDIHLNVFDYNKNRVFSPKEIPILNETGMAEFLKDSKGNYWIMNNKGIIFYDNKNFKLYTQADGFYKGEGTISMAEDKNGHIWVVQWNAPVAKFDGKIWHQLTIKDGLYANQLTKIYKDKEGNLWIPYNADKGVYSKYDGKTFIHYSINFKNAPNLSITNIFIDKEHNFWFSTWEHGIFKYDGKEYKNYNTKNGLGINSIKQIEQDYMGNLWIAGNSDMISKYIPSTEEFINYNSNKDFGLAGIYKIVVTPDSVIWFNSIKHQIKILPKQINYNKNINSISYVLVKDTLKFSHVGNRLNTKQVFNYKQNDIKFEFAGINSGSADKKMYRVFLEGYDLNWSEPSPYAFATYTNLPDGDYTFKMISRNQYGTWNDIPALFQFKILPPWWKQWWFYGILVITSVLLVFSIIKYRTYKLISEKKHLEEIVHQRTFEIEQQKEEIQSQRDQLQHKNQEIIQQKNEIEYQRDELQLMNHEVSKQHEEIKSSIRYAMTIQQAILPTKEELDRLFESFVIYMPKDIVSGDFYWYADFPDENKLYFALADCTGHGVPGAFMSLIGNRSLNDIVNINRIVSPCEILTNLDNEIRQILRHQDEDACDGMDIGICLFEKLTDTKTKVTFTGSIHSLYYYSQQNHELNMIKGCRKEIGSFRRLEIKFTNNEVILDKGDMLYMFSDGFTDQNNMVRKKFGISKLILLLNNIALKPIQEQEAIIGNELAVWMEDTTQRDDISFVGIKI